MPSLPAELQIGDDGEVIGADEGPACNPSDGDSAADRQAVADAIRPSTAHRKLFERLLSRRSTVPRRPRLARDSGGWRLTLPRA